ncbi:MAG: hypothetical protein RJQ01_06895 [Microcella sp.]|uniref:maleylpyruvate isomerase N-terminal domain-containing protein n=1 Tax=Microcella sp. TaxID=1913979 RepID=UPI00331596D3
MGDRDRTLTQRIETLSAVLIDEVSRRHAIEAVHSSAWPTVGTIAGHVAAVYGWVTTIVRTGAPASPSEVVLDDADMVTVLADARSTLLDALRGDDRECWILGGGTGSTAFWRRRMVLETLKHVLDVRTAPGEPFAIAPELDAATADDGIDEFLAVFLARSRPTLVPLPGSVRLTATDLERSWLLGTDWSVTSDGSVQSDGADAGSADAAIKGSAAALLLLLWERASALDEPDRFAVTGDRELVRALQDSPIHP